MTNDLGCLKEELDTPALCVDLGAFDSNVDVIASQCRQHRVAWRPHAKSHKSSIIAQRLVAAGAIGATCAKLGEAEVLAAGGIRDLLIANLLVGPKKIARLVELRRHADPIICIDHIEQAHPISATFGSNGMTLRVMIELDIGMRRAGVLPGQPALQLARQVKELPGIKLCGLMGYEGHLLLINDAVEKRRQIWESLDLLAQTKSLLVAQGIECPMVSCGGTGSLDVSIGHPIATEIQAGGGIFMDEFYRNRCHIPGLRQALTIVSTVVSRPAADRAIVDAGRKTMNQELAMPRVINRPGVEIAFLSAEHGVLKLDADAEPLRIGERVEFIPGYGDFTTVLHDRFFALRGGRVEAIWPLEARGRLT